jgi:hypothetical protein
VDLWSSSITQTDRVLHDWMLGRIDHCDCSRMSCGGLVAAERPPVFARLTLGALSFYWHGLDVRTTIESLRYATSPVGSSLSYILPLSHASFGRVASAM